MVFGVFLEWNFGVVFLEWNFGVFFLESKFGVSFVDFSLDNQTEHKQTDRYRESETDRQTVTDTITHRDARKCLQTDKYKHTV